MSSTEGTQESRGCRKGPQIGKHTSELQSHSDLVCRLLLEKKKKKHKKTKKKNTKKKTIKTNNKKKKQKNIFTNYY